MEFRQLNIFIQGGKISKFFKSRRASLETHSLLSQYRSECWKKNKIPDYLTGWGKKFF